MVHDSRIDNFGDIVRRRREALDLSISEVARRAHLDESSLSLLERGRNRPKPDTVRALADVLGLPASDLFAAADYLRSNELPSIRPYMRAKFSDLLEDAVLQVERFVEHLQGRLGVAGPIDHEDER